LVVLLSFLDEAEVVKDKLKYSVRPETDEFLRTYILNKNINENDWKTFLKAPKSAEIKDYNHQDIYYLFTAYNTIRDWFQNRSKDEFKNILYHKVKLIVNKPYTDNEQELFMNLNTGKVSLDGADLIRALLITNIAKEELYGDNLNDTKSIVRLNERRIRIGLELDEISAWWNQVGVKTYFNWLNKITIPSAETIDFNSEVYPINLLYKLYLSKNGKKEIKLRDFEIHQYIDLYKDLISLHRTIKDWYEDCEIYHFVKFLIAHTNTSFEKIWNMWCEPTTDRRSFIVQIKEQVKCSIKDESINNIDNTKENWFYNDDLCKILILLDIIQIINSQKKGNKLPYLAPQHFRPELEDREHIFPQTPISQKDIEKPTPELKNKIEKYLNILRMILIDVSSITLNDINWTSPKDDIVKLKDDINKKISGVIDINSIGNICLLHKHVNRSYGNNFYTLKRHEIIKNTRNGEYIRPHTLNAFDKGYSEIVDNLDCWTNNDIKANAQYIKKQIVDFFNIKEFENENK